MVTIGSILSAILAALALLHFYWAFGGSRVLTGAVPTVDGRPLFVPSTTATVVVGLALTSGALLVLWRMHLIELPAPAWIPRAGVWTLAGVFAARAIGDFHYVGFFKRERSSLFARRDTRIYSPLCVLLSALACATGLLAP